MLLMITTTVLFLIGSVAASACNNNPALCSRKYSEVTQIGTHDSAFVGDFVTDNQGLSLTDQLNAGIRFLQAQTHDFLGQIFMCHTSCWERNAGLLVDYLTTVRNWMDANPNEVVTLLLTNGDNVDVGKFGDAMNRAGLAKYAYTPPKKLALSEWPTLQELINANTRLVMFMDYHADTSKVSYILDEFSYMFETPYDVTTPDFPDCSLDRPPGSNGDGLMYIVNHFLDLDIFGIKVPDVAHTPRTNAATGAGSIGAQSDLCTQKWGRKPTFILVDYFENGDVFTAQNTLNAL
ncbi:PLC-like phosphodiesterase [Venustampulla echinocandica]|uniref:PLC-like phosphodiesterase n=1 Tax=Venustampulla echinocandica TaxID=2656787 RepID=A0A370TPP0_9HELO|nr:PLC-like phosphodiesterase [Venustampulla echinocandica]RDL37484.1 PLC-like phosphodiesterase [Venustampulla echinocandica]